MDLACQRGERLLFRNVSLALEAGQALRITGPNGTGKPSLMRVLAGLLRPWSGSVEREGAAGLLDERPALDEHEPLARALALWSKIDGDHDHYDMGGALQRLGLEHLTDVPVRFLSTGQRKRAAFARLMGQGAQIWLLDEPLNGLDRDAATDCEWLVQDHCRAGGIAVIASHQEFGLTGMTVLPLHDFAP